jgi:hypothetical protein
VSQAERSTPTIGHAIRLLDQMSSACERSTAPTWMGRVRHTLQSRAASGPAACDWRRPSSSSWAFYRRGQASVWVQHHNDIEFMECVSFAGLEDEDSHEVAPPA